MDDDRFEGLTPSQNGSTEMDPAEFRRAAHRVADLAADYFDRLESYRVTPPVRPGDLRAALPPDPPARPEPLAAILDDYLRLVEPNVTHWQHPMFLAYFSSVATGPGILGEWLASTLNSNVMFWKNAPASTELEEVVVAWLRSMLGLPETFDGMLTDTASISSLLSIVAARHAVPGLDARDRGLAGRADVGPLTLYRSSEGHSSIDKGAIAAGVGRGWIRAVEVDSEFRMRPEALARAIAEDRAAGRTPFCVVATLGTTSSTSIDPVREIADVCDRERVWLHVDAAYGGAAALAPELRDRLAGWERAESIVVNPHKWMFTPFDASLLLFRRPDVYRDAFHLLPDYIRGSQLQGAHNFHEYGVQMGRRFRALKLWMLVRWFGVEGMAARIRKHCGLAGVLASWIDGDEEWQRLAPVPFATVCFRHRPRALRGREDRPEVSRAIDEANERILARVNEGGEVYLSGTRLAGCYSLRVAIGNPRTELRHVRRCWELLREAAEVEGPAARA